MDAQTLLIINVSVATLLAFTMVGLYTTNRQDKCLAHWALAAAGFLGNALLNLTYQPDSTPYLFGPPLGNTLLFSAYICLLSGLCHFVQRPLPTLLWPGLLVLFYLLNLTDFAREHFINRTLLCFPLLIVVNLCLLYQLSRAGQQVLRFATVLFGVVAALNLLQLSSRLTLFWLDPLGDANLRAEPLMHHFGTLAILIFMLGSQTSCLLLVVSQKTRQLQQLAQTDALTGWLNRQSLYQRLSSEWQRCSRQQQPISLLMFDVDHFKQVNDQYGHQVGDRVLEQISAGAASVFRNYDLQFRLGGEEFLVGLPGVDATQLQVISERLRQMVANCRFDSEPSLKVTVSIGCATADPSRTGWQPLLEIADRALYRAKANGRNRIEFCQSAWVQA
jgi:diguanylate cyclase (GGDEF)-like protein